MYLNPKEIAFATGGTIIGDNEKIITNIQTDSRKIQENSLFVPIKGENFDGHDFIEQVITNGCQVVLTHNELCYKENVCYIKVIDTIKALGDIASYYLDRFHLKKIAITGSVGKTTTKDMISSVVNMSGKTLKTEGNFNNNIGLPKTVFGLDESYKNIVLEMGMNHFDEISYLSNIVKPHIGVISNIGHSHIENLGSKEGILKAKLEICDGMDKDGVLILNGDDPLLYSVKDKINQKIIYFGIENQNSDYKAVLKEETAEYIEFTVNEIDYKIYALGEHNVYNGLCAIIVGKVLGLSDEKIKEGLLSYKPTGMRMELKQKNGYQVLVDCYNSAPDSILASLKVIKNNPLAKRRIAVLGSVAELGDYRDKLLYEVGKQIKSFNIDLLITVGEDAIAIYNGALDSGFSNSINFKNNEQVKNYLNENIKCDDLILVKASRKYKLEEISDFLLKGEL